MLALFNHAANDKYTLLFNILLPDLNFASTTHNAHPKSRQKILSSFGIYTSLSTKRSR